MKIIWLPVAQEDLNHVFDFYAAQSVSVAIDIYNNIIAEADILINHPHIGQVEWDCRRDPKSIRRNFK